MLNSHGDTPYHEWPYMGRLKQKRIGNLQVEVLPYERVGKCGIQLLQRAFN